MKPLTKEQADWLIEKFEKTQINNPPLIHGIPHISLDMGWVAKVINQCTDALPVKVDIDGGYVLIKRNAFNDNAISIGVYWHDNSSNGHAITVPQLKKLHEDLGNLLGKINDQN